MRNMLDTHVALWFLNSERLTEKIKDLIIYGDNYISVVSLWEVAIKMNIGKYNMMCRGFGK